MLINGLVFLPMILLIIICANLYLNVSDLEGRLRFLEGLIYSEDDADLVEDRG